MIIIVSGKDGRQSLVDVCSYDGLLSSQPLPPTRSPSNSDLAAHFLQLPHQFLMLLPLSCLFGREDVGRGKCSA